MVQHTTHDCCCPELFYCFTTPGISQGCRPSCHVSFLCMCVGICTHVFAFALEATARQFKSMSLFCHPPSPYKIYLEHPSTGWYSTCIFYYNYKDHLSIINVPGPPQLGSPCIFSTGATLRQYRTGRLRDFAPKRRVFQVYYILYGEGGG